MNEGKITVWIKCKQMMHYHQLVELTHKEYEILNRVNGDDVNQRDDAELYSIIENHIDYSNIFDSDVEFIDFSMQAEDGKAHQQSITK